MPFEELADAELAVARTYRGRGAGGAGDDPINKLLPVGNQGGFRNLAIRSRTQ